MAKARSMRWAPSSTRTRMKRSGTSRTGRQGPGGGRKIRCLMANGFQRKKKKKLHSLIDHGCVCAGVRGARLSVSPLTFEPGHLPKQSGASFASNQATTLVSFMARKKRVVRRLSNRLYYPEAEKNNYQRKVYFDQSTL